MKKWLSILILTALVCTSCESDEQINFRLASGTYKGTFSRSSPNAKWAASNVTLIINDNQFSGSSDVPKYPAIGEGTYSIRNADTIEFSSACVWTAEFDWSFILNGKYKISKVVNEIVITRSYKNETFDTYQLRME